ncbi:outer membrane beta-barrel protein [Chryseobacterium sp. Chry.R1]|uniref:outer membrane beta-barrel protein n=1 Tax=Chryseobacterium sp. Chry.R1 TaxID=3139392 RepID=UPI0031FA0DA3
MSNQWLNDLRRKMEDHEGDVPDGLWDNIKDELFDKDEDKNIVGLFTEANKAIDSEDSDSNKKRGAFIYRIAGIAAAIALFFIVGKQLWEVNNNVKPKIAKSEDKGSAESNFQTPDNHISLFNEKEESDVLKEFGQKKDSPLDQDIFSTNVYAYGNRSGVRNVQYRSVNEETDLLAGLHRQYAPLIQNQIPGIREMKNLLPINREEEINKLISETDLGVQGKSLANTLKEKKQKTKKSWMLSLLTGKASSNSQQFPGYATISGGPLTLDQVWSASAFSEDPFVKVLVANQSQNVEATVRHKVPLNLGVSLYYNLGEKWGIGTGLNYTKLSSELHSGSQSNFVKSEQTIHYVGIPVQVNYNVIQKGNFTGYVTAGALAEKSVGGSFKTQYIVDNEVNGETKEKLGNQPVQVSLNTALGLQLKLVDKIGIYAEPGIGYHFKNDGALNTIYKEKPLNFNVKFGIRVLLD